MVFDGKFFSAFEFIFEEFYNEVYKKRSDNRIQTAWQGIFLKNEFGVVEIPDEVEEEEIETLVEENTERGNNHDIKDILSEEMAEDEGSKNAAYQDKEGVETQETGSGDIEQQTAEKTDKGGIKFIFKHGNAYRNGEEQEGFYRRTGIGEDESENDDKYIREPAKKTASTFILIIVEFNFHSFHPVTLVLQAALPSGTHLLSGYTSLVCLWLLDYTVWHRADVFQVSRRHVSSSGYGIARHCQKIQNRARQI